MGRQYRETVSSEVWGENHAGVAESIGDVYIQGELTQDSLGSPLGPRVHPTLSCTQFIYVAFLFSTCGSPG